MKKLIIALAALPIATYAAGASAQTYSNSGQTYANSGQAYANSGGTIAVQNRIANLEGRFNAGVNAGVFTNAERSSLARQLNDLRQLERSYSYNGLTQVERRTLQQRIRTVRDQLRTAGGTNWSRNYGWTDTELDARADAYGQSGAYDAYGRPIPQQGTTYDRYGRPIADTRIVYDQYGRPIYNTGVATDRYGRPVANNGGYDQYGRPVNGGYSGQGGPYEPVPQGNVGGNVLGGVLGSVLGGGSGMGGILGSILGRGGLRTGDVITSTIGSVLGGASNFGSQYRDNSNVYYRSDGERVYEIDARTHVVNRVYPVQR